MTPEYLKATDFLKERKEITQEINDSRHLFINETFTPKMNKIYDSLKENREDIINLKKDTEHTLVALAEIKKILNEQKKEYATKASVERLWAI